MSVEEFVVEELKRLDLLTDEGVAAREDEVALVDAIIDTAKSLSESLTAMELITISRILPRLLMGQPMSALTGEEDEWEAAPTDDDPNQLVNKRCRSVFKSGNSVWDVHAKIFVSPDTGPFVGDESILPVTFPYLPQAQYIKIPAIPKAKK